MKVYDELHVRSEPFLEGVWCCAVLYAACWVRLPSTKMCRCRFFRSRCCSFVPVVTGDVNLQEQCKVGQLLWRRSIYYMSVSSCKGSSTADVTTASSITSPVSGKIRVAHRA
jgi:hypothetical protein